MDEDRYLVDYCFGQPNNNSNYFEFDCLDNVYEDLRVAINEELKGDDNNLNDQKENDNLTKLEKLCVCQSCKISVYL